MTQFPDVGRNGWYSANRTPLVEGYVSETMNGAQVAPLMGDYTDTDVGTFANTHASEYVAPRELRPRRYHAFYSRPECSEPRSV